MAFQDYFSVVAFFIFLRETLEASVIIAVLLQCMNRTCPRLKKQGAGGLWCLSVREAWSGGRHARPDTYQQQQAVLQMLSRAFLCCVAHPSCCHTL